MSTSSERIQDVQEILRIFSDSPLQELRLEVGDLLLHVSKDPEATLPGIDAAAAPARSVAARPVLSVEDQAPRAASEARDVRVVPEEQARPAAVERQGLVPVVSPSVGIFYRRPSAELPPYVDVGDEVASHTPVATLEVMKMYTQVVAGCDGTVVEFCVENGELVEFEQTLMYVRPPGNDS